MAYLDSISIGECFQAKIDNGEISDSLNNLINDNSMLMQYYWDIGDSTNAMNLCIWFFNLFQCTEIDNYEDLLNEDNFNRSIVIENSYFAQTSWDTIVKQFPNILKLNNESQSTIITLAQILRIQSNKTKALSAADCKKIFDTDVAWAVGLYTIGLTGCTATAIATMGWGSVICVTYVTAQFVNRSATIKRNYNNCLNGH